MSFPELQKAQSLILNTTSPTFDCAPLEEYRNVIVHDTLTCGINLNTTPSSSSSLSTGAKAGIGIGAAAAVILAAALLALLYRRHQRRRSASHNVAQGHATGPVDGAQKAVGHEALPANVDAMAVAPPLYPGSPLLGDKPYHVAQRVSMASPAATELEVPVLHELPAGHQAVELPGGSE